MARKTTIKVHRSNGRRARPRRRVAALRASSVVALALGVVFGLGAAQIAQADAPSTVAVDVAVSGNTVTVSGSYTWKECTKSAGFAVAWNDPASPGNLVANGVYVGTTEDNAIHPASNCLFGPISHTYADSLTTTHDVCVVMYDMKPAKPPKPPQPPQPPQPQPQPPKPPKPPKPPVAVPGVKVGGKKGPGGVEPVKPVAEMNLIAGGLGHQTDNSVEENEQTPVCGQVTTAPPVVHVPTLSGSATCDQSTGTYAVTYTGESDGAISTSVDLPVTHIVWGDSTSDSQTVTFGYADGPDVTRTADVALEGSCTQTVDETVDSCPAAPAVAVSLLRENLTAPKAADVRNYVSQVAIHMGPQTTFDGVDACDQGYRGAVDTYLRSIGAY